MTLPTRFPVILPDELIDEKSPAPAAKLALVNDKLPVDAPVNEPVPTTTLSLDSSQPINTLSELPLSITKPASFKGEPDVPFPNSIRASVICVLVVLTVVVVPFTVKLPVIVALPATLIFVEVISSDVNVPSTCTSLN